MFTKMWKNNFKLSQFSLNYPYPEHFSMSIFQKADNVSVWFFSYRGILALYFIATTMYIVLYRNLEPWKFFIFLTNWSYVLETFLFNFGFVLIIARYMKEKKERSDIAQMEEGNNSTSETEISQAAQLPKGREKRRLSIFLSVPFLGTKLTESKNVIPQTVETADSKEPSKEIPRVVEIRKKSGRMNFCLKLYWCSYTIVLSISLGIVVIFWGAIYDPEVFPSLPKNIVVHVLNGGLMIVDFILIAHPIKLLHFYWPLLYGLTYVLFSCVYQMSGGTGGSDSISIYKILDWNEPLKALIVCLLCIFVCITLHVICCLFSLLKFKLKNWSHSEVNH